MTRTRYSKSRNTYRALADAVLLRIALGRGLTFECNRSIDVVLENVETHVCTSRIQCGTEGVFVDF